MLRFKMNHTFKRTNRMDWMRVCGPAFHVWEEEVVYNKISSRIQTNTQFIIISIQESDDNFIFICGTAPVRLNRLRVVNKNNIFNNIVALFSLKQNHIVIKMD